MKFPCISEVLSEKITGEWGKEAKDNGVRVIRTTNFRNNGELNLLDVAQRHIPDQIVKKKCLKNGDIIIEKSGGSPTQPVGRVVYFDIDDGNTYLCNNFTSILRPSPSVNSKYLFYCLYYLHLTKRTLKYQNKTTGIINLQLQRYLDTESIPTPSIQEQLEIVKSLDLISELIKKRKTSIELLETYVQSKFLDLCSHRSEDYKNWQLVKLEDLVKPDKGTMRTGPFGSDLLHSEFVDSGIAVIGIDNAVQNKFAWGQRRYITKEKYEKLKRYTLFPEDVVITIMGTVGRSAVIPNDIPLSINTKHLAALTLDKNKANPYYISYSIYSDPFIDKQIKKQGKGAIMTGLNLGIIKELEFKLPPIGKQNQFASLLNEKEILKEKMENQSVQLENHFQTLTQKYFTTN